MDILCVKNYNNTKWQPTNTTNNTTNNTTTNTTNTTTSNDTSQLTYTQVITVNMNQTADVRVSHII